MHHFSYKNAELYCEDVPVRKIADHVGTPFYLYSHATLVRHFNAFDSAFDGIEHLTCFSVKSNSNIAILRLFSRLGAGADIVSGGELYRVLKAGIDPAKVVYSGVGKTEDEMEYALNSGILMFTLDLAIFSKTSPDESSDNSTWILFHSVFRASRSLIKP
jgi:diaminopimelate decarboxylase